MITRILTLLAATCFMAAPLLASEPSMVGKWKFNPEKSKLTGLDYKIEDAGGGKYRFIFGDDVETLTLDGKGHLTKYGNTWSIKVTGPSNWDSTTTRDGKVTNKSKWSISKDGKTFTAVDETRRPDGSTGRSESTLKRISGTSGLAGSWKVTSVKILSPMSIEMAAWEGAGYSLINPAYKERLDFQLNGKGYTPHGPRVPNGTAVTARKIDDRTIELTYKLKGKVTETDKWALSKNGNTLTQTVTYAGVSKPEVDVYERE